MLRRGPGRLVLQGPGVSSHQGPYRSPVIAAFIVPA
jgi:hypothetical protein